MLQLHLQIFFLSVDNKGLFFLLHLTKRVNVEITKCKSKSKLGKKSKLGERTMTKSFFFVILFNFVSSTKIITWKICDVSMLF